MAGEIQLNSVSLATESGSAITLGSAVSLNSAAYASTSEVQGTHTTGTITSETTSLTVASGSGISNGDYVVGEGIAPGTTVSSGGGTTSITLSANAAATLSSDPVVFYTANKALSPGLVAGGLCRAWGCIDGNGTILSSYNVSSVSGTSVNYTVNFLTNMPTDDYAVVVGLKNNYANNTRLPGIFLKTGSTTSTSEFTLQSALGANASTSGTTTSLDEFYFAVFR